MIRKTVVALLAVIFGVGVACAQGKHKNPVVQMDTSMGSVKIELFEKEAPITVKNFLEYAKSGFYAGTVFHRIIPSSPDSSIAVVQGGGLTKELQPKSTRAPIKNEADNGLKNDRGTIAMARGGDPNSATSQFFINVSNNTFLNRPSPDGFGYAVFGKVIDGMEIIDKMIAVPQMRKNSVFQNVPVEPIVIKSVTLIGPK